MMNRKIFFTLVLCGLAGMAWAQKEGHYRRAMRDELDRNMKQLHISGLQPLFFASYALADGTSLMIQSQDGCVIQSQVRPMVMPVVRTLTGDYRMTNEVAGQFRNAVSEPMPIDGNYDETRRVLWLATDAAYKMSAQEYTAKQNMIRQRNIQEDELAIPDMSKVTPVQKEIVNPVNRNVDLSKLEKYMKEISKEFRKYPELDKSNAVLYGFLGNLYYVSSEGTDISIPQNGLTLTITAGVYTSNYAYLDNAFSVSVASPEDLPSISELRPDIGKLATHLVGIKNLKPMAENYFGPVLLENVAVGDFLDMCLIPGLINQKAWLGQKNVKLPEDKLGKKLTASGFSVIGMPKMKTYKGKKLSGAFELDYDGVEPADRLVLVEDGLVKNLLSNRICTKKIRTSNGYCRPNLENGLLPMIAPGVLKMHSATNTVADRDMKQKLIEAAKKEGLDYAYAVRHLRGRQGGIQATEIYRVYTDGHEELEQGGLLNLSPASLRRITFVSDKEYVDNRTTNGFHVSYIYPASMLVEEVEVDPYEAPGAQPPLVKDPKTIILK